MNVADTSHGGPAIEQPDSRPHLPLGHPQLLSDPLAQRRPRHAHAASSRMNPNRQVEPIARLAGLRNRQVEPNGGRSPEGKGLAHGGYGGLEGYGERGGYELLTAHASHRIRHSK